MGPDITEWQGTVFVITGFVIQRNPDITKPTDNKDPGITNDVQQPMPVAIHFTVAGQKNIVVLYGCTGVFIM